MAAQRASGRLRWAAATVLVTALVTALVVAPLSRPARAAELFGHDISWPQCPGGHPMPPTSTQFVVVGLTRGLAFTENPCLEWQHDWVVAHRKPAHAYAMGTYPTAAQLAAYGDDGPWQATTLAGRLSNAGYAEATFAVRSLARIGWRPPVVWIDVEPRPAQPWPGGAAGHQRNRLVLEGLMRGLREAGYAYGLYSYANGWREVVGDWRLPGVPVWATAGREGGSAEARRLCAGPSFSGGRVHLAQWYDDTRDYDLTCSWYSFTPLPLTPASGTGSLHDFDADWRDDVVRLTDDGTLWLHRGTGRGGLSAPAAVRTGWSHVRDLAGPGDFNANGTHDLLVLDRSGQLLFHRGGGRGGFTLPAVIATGWGSTRLIAGPGDLSGDGRNDVLGLGVAGRLWLYRGTDTGRLGTRSLVASGWEGFTDVVGVGDLTGDGRPDVLALGFAGRLWLYPGNGAGGLGPRIFVDRGWQGARLAGPGDLDGDRVPDVLSLGPGGRLWLYPGRTGGALGPRSLVASGWAGVAQYF